jgi:predicted nucleic acid-binding protein
MHRVTHEVFVDASAWIAVADRRDAYHEAAAPFYFFEVAGFAVLPARQA